MGPCAVPSVCKYNLLLNIELVHYNYRRKALRIHEVGGFRIDLVLGKHCAVFIPDFLWILRSIFTPSKLIKKVFSGITLLFKWSNIIQMIMAFISFVSLICDDKFYAS